MTKTYVFHVALQFLGFCGCVLTSLIYGYNANNSDPLYHADWNSISVIPNGSKDLARLLSACRGIPIGAIIVNAFFFAVPEFYGKYGTIAVRILQIFLSASLGCSPIVDQMMTRYIQGTGPQDSLFINLSYVAFGGGVLSGVMAIGLAITGSNIRIRNSASTKEEKEGA